MSLIARRVRDARPPPAAAAFFEADGLPGYSRPLLEHDPVVVEQLALEADAVGADAGRERQPEVGARQPAGEQPELEQGLAHARASEPRAPLIDRLDVVQPAADA